MKKTTWKYLVDVILFLSIVGLAVIGFLMGFVLPKGPAASESAKYFLGLHRHQWGDIHLYLGIVFTVMAVLHLILAWDWIKGKTRQMFGAKWKAALLSAPALAVAILVSFWAYWAANPNPYAEYGTPRGERRSPQSPASSTARLGDAVTELSETRDESGAQPMISEGLETPAEYIQPSVEEHDHDEAELTRGRHAEAQSGILITGQMSLYDVEEQTGVSARAIADRIGIPPDVPLDEHLGRLRKSYPFTIQQVRDVVSELMIRY